MDSIDYGILFLLVIAILIPIVGFVLTIRHARGGISRAEQRWRKRHGLIFWVLVPGITGAATVLGLIEALPRLFSIVGILLLALATSWSFQLQKRHETRLAERRLGG